MNKLEVSWEDDKTPTSIKIKDDMVFITFDGEIKIHRFKLIDVY